MKNIPPSIWLFVAALVGYFLMHKYAPELEPALVFFLILRECERFEHASKTGEPWL
jgi:hypothetical protein